MLPPGYRRYQVFEREVNFYRELKCYQILEAASASDLNSNNFFQARPTAVFSAV